MPAFLPLILVLLVAGAALLAAVVYLMARGLVRPPRMTDAKALHVLRRLTPTDVGLPWRAATFTVVDPAAGGGRLKLAAWWVPAGRTSTRTVVLVHGYADAKVGALAWAPAWHGLGFNILAVDLRAHGDSEGHLCAGGYHERHDLLQVVHELVAREPAAVRTLVLFGASLGAAVVAGAAALLSPAPAVPAESRDERRNPPDVLPVASDPPGVLDGVVLESPFADFRSAAAAHWDRSGFPAGAVGRLALRAAEAMTGARFADVRPADLIRRTGCPVLVLAGGSDAFVSPAEAAEVEAAVRDRPTAAGPSGYRRFEEAEHLMAVVAEPDAYRVELRAFADALAAARSSRGVP